MAPCHRMFSLCPTIRLAPGIPKIIPLSPNANRLIYLEAKPGENRVNKSNPKAIHYTQMQMRWPMALFRPEEDDVACLLLPQTQCPRQVILPK